MNDHPSWEVLFLRHSTNNHKEKDLSNASPLATEQGLRLRLWDAIRGKVDVAVDLCLFNTDLRLGPFIKCDLHANSQ